MIDEVPIAEPQGPVPVPTGRYAASAVEAMQIKQKVMSQINTNGSNKYYIPRVPVDFSEEEYEHLEDEAENYENENHCISIRFVMISFTLGP